MIGWRPARPRQINLLGDRDIEWSWVAARLPLGHGKALDFGNGGSALSLLAAQSGYQVTAIDLEAYQWPYEFPGLAFMQADLMDADLEEGSFDLVINCSTVEHVGIVGRYSVSRPDPDGDLVAMRRLGDLMKPGATMLLTVPLGRDAIFPPMCRVYGAARLPKLLGDFAVEADSYWSKNSANRWVQVTREEGLNFEAHAGSPRAMENIYAIGCFVLRKRADSA
ncbi:MAG TPA: DUF268 domain-containing protein [Candidatus Solibacter sp.]|nr:DUF268 domain-containing protein [Candidatus Solibacter sp.]